MRLLLALTVIVYLAGVGVTLAPIVQSSLASETASAFLDTLGREVPDALAWPARFAAAHAR